MLGGRGRGRGGVRRGGVRGVEPPPHHDGGRLNSIPPYQAAILRLNQSPCPTRQRTASHRVTRHTIFSISRRSSPRRFTRFRRSSPCCGGRGRCGGGWRLLNATKQNDIFEWLPPDTPNRSPPPCPLPRTGNNLSRGGACTPPSPATRALSKTGIEAGDGSCGHCGAGGAGA